MKSIVLTTIALAFLAIPSLHAAEPGWSELEK